MSEPDAFEAIAAELYGLTPGEFTTARNGYAKELKADGDKELSERIKELRKPATAAWVVNMLVRHDADEISAALDLGESLRQAAVDLDGDALRELNRQRRRLITAIAGKGRNLARDLGQKISESVVRQVEDTLHAAMIDGDAAAAVRTGLLIEPLEAAGMGSMKVASAVENTALGRGARPLSEVAGPPGKRATRSLRAVPGPDPEERRREERRKAREQADAAVAEAEATLERARSERDEREKALQELQAGCLQVNGEIDELKRRIDELEARLEELDEEADGVRTERDEAAEQVALAESALAEAQQARDKLAD